MSHHISGEKNRGLPGPANYKVLHDSQSVIISANFRKAGRITEFGFVNKRHPKPDFASYTPIDKKSKSPGFTKIDPVSQHASASVNFFRAKRHVKSGVGPASYNVTPNIQKKNNNSRTFGTALRRFKFND